MKWIITTLVAGILLISHQANCQRGGYDFSGNSIVSPQSASSAARGPGGPSVQCRRTEVRPGAFNYDCSDINPQDITLQAEHTLWLTPRGTDQELNIPVKNYRLEEYIRAALKTVGGVKTLVNILLQRPESVYDIQADDSPIITTNPHVQIQYEKPGPEIKLHYPVDRPYNPLKGPIRDPSPGGPGTGLPQGYPANSLLEVDGSSRYEKRIRAPRAPREAERIDEADAFNFGERLRTFRY